MIAFGSGNYDWPVLFPFVPSYLPRFMLMTCIGSYIVAEHQHITYLDSIFIDRLTVVPKVILPHMIHSQAPFLVQGATQSKPAAVITAHGQGARC
jgi:hypothetical protein